MKQLIIAGALCLVAFSCSHHKKADKDQPDQAMVPEATSLLGEPLFPAKPSEKLLASFQKHKAAYETTPDDVDKLIWYGRFMAYKGDYRKAIEIYTKGIEKFPHDAHLYRHRGHRYISIRAFDLAIQDLEYATGLIEGKANEIEPDGMPNAQNIPVSTLHGNIWYHLGLAYYLKHDLENALRAYQKCLSSTDNDDNLVSATHWIYMILRRMDRKITADQYLTAISTDLNVIENTDYHRVCLFYKGLLSMEELDGHEGTGPGNDAVSYAIGNWHFYHGEKEKAREVFENILKRKSWSSFGYIAAESDYAKEFR